MKKENCQINLDYEDILTGEKAKSSMKGWDVQVLTK